jgi:hypothetical protein
MASRVPPDPQSARALPLGQGRDKFLSGKMRPIISSNAGPAVTCGAVFMQGVARISTSPVCRCVVWWGVFEFCCCYLHNHKNTQTYSLRKFQEHFLGSEPVPHGRSYGLGCGPIMGGDDAFPGSVTTRSAMNS